MEKPMVPYLSPEAIAAVKAAALEAMKGECEAQSSARSATRSCPPPMSRGLGHGLPTFAKGGHFVQVDEEEEKRTWWSTTAIKGVVNEGYKA